jgi:hypothetical protein
MATCIAGSNDPGARFWRSAVEAKLPNAEQKLVSKVPPPEREIVYLVKFCLLDELMSSKTTTVCAFGATESLFLSGRDMKTDFLNIFSGLIGRIVRDNPNIKYYGINVLFLFVPASGAGLMQDEADTEQVRAALYSLAHTWCVQLSSTAGVTVTFDFVCDEGDFAYVLRNELRRVMHGDMLAQFGGAY